MKSKWKSKQDTGAGGLVKKPKRIPEGSFLSLLKVKGADAGALPMSMQGLMQGPAACTDLITCQIMSMQGDCRKEPRRDPLCTKTKINQNS